jgi:hypothetical protein
MAKIDQGKIRDFIEECSLMIIEHNDMIDYGLNDKEIDWLVKEGYLMYNYLSGYYFWEDEGERFEI